MVSAAALLISTGHESQPAARPRIESDVSFTANLVHWVDNLAGTSVGKTMPFYRPYWERRFGPLTPDDQAALDDFARIRRAPMLSAGRDVVNQSGCLPVAADGLVWHQVFLVEAMSARSLDGLREGLASHLGAADLDRVMGALQRFRPRFEEVWKDLDYVRRFEARFKRYLAAGELPAYLASVAGFFGVTPRDDQPMKISFIGLPSDDEATHAEADGDHLLIEIRPSDTPHDQVQVVAHEASHFLMRRMDAARIDGLARQAFGEGEAGALFWRYMWEGLPTALGQGLAEAKLTPSEFSLSHRWYHIDTIDRFAKLIYPAVARAFAASQRLDDGLVPSLTRTLAVSELMSEARPNEFLMTAFFASGEGLGDEMDLLRRRLALRGDAGSKSFALDDPEAPELLRRYACLGGVALVRPADLERVNTLEGSPWLSAEVVAQARQQASRGVAVIASGRRAGGGPVFVLVAPKDSLIRPLVEALGRFRGLPDRLILITGEPGS